MCLFRVEKSKSSGRSASAHTTARHGERKRYAHRSSGPLCNRTLTNRQSGRVGQQCWCVGCRLIYRQAIFQRNGFLEEFTLSCRHLVSRCHSRCGHDEGAERARDDDARQPSLARMPLNYSLNYE